MTSNNNYGYAGCLQYTLSGTITLNATSDIGGYNANDINITGNVTGPGGLVKGVTTRTEDADVLTLSSTLNNFVGGVTINHGTLRLGVANAIPSGPGVGGVVVNGTAVTASMGPTATPIITTGTSLNQTGTLDLENFSVTLNSLSGNGNVFRYQPVTPFNNDASSGIPKVLPPLPARSAPTTHGCIDFGDGAGATVGGLIFTSVSTSTNPSGTNYSTTSLSGLITEAQGTTLATGYGNSVDTAAGFFSNSTGFAELFKDFNYNAGTVNTSTAEGITLTGLIPGTTYQTQIYVRKWTDSPGRTNVATFNPGGTAATTSIDYSLDANGTYTRYVSYQYVAASTSLVITLNSQDGGSWHQYGLTNQVIATAAAPLPTPTLTLGSDGTNATFTGDLENQNGNLVKIGNGTQVLSSSTTPLGGSPNIKLGNAVTVNSGSLSIGTAANYSATSFVNNGSMTFVSNIATTFSTPITGNGNVTFTAAGPLTINTPINTTGNFTINAASTIAYATPVTAAANFIVNATGGPASPTTFSDAISETGAVTFSSNGSLAVNSLISGGGTVTTNGLGAVTFNGAVSNTYTGTTTVASGILELAAPNGVNAIPGNLVVGDGGTTLARLQLAAPNQIADTAAVTVNANGVFDASFDETVSSLQGTGTIVTGNSFVAQTGTFTTDLMSGVSPGKTYTQLLDFGTGGATTINGVAFTKATSATVSSAFTLSGATANGTNANTGVATGSGLSSLLTDYSTGTAGNSLTLNNLVVGTTYETRLFIRPDVANTNAPAFDRMQTLTFTPGGAGTPSSMNVQEDALQGPTYVDYRFTATSTSLTVTTTPVTVGTSFVFYGATNEVVPAQTTTPTLTVGDNTNTTFTGTFVGTGAVVKQGSGTLTLAGAGITYTGGTTISAGVLQLLDTSSFNSPIVDNGLLTLNGTLTVADPLNAGGSINNVGTILNQPITGSGSVTKVGTGFATLAGSGNNSWAGGTTVLAGTLDLAKTSGNAVPGNVTVGIGGTTAAGLLLGGSNQIPDAAIVTLGSNGTFDLNIYDETVAEIVGTGTITRGTLATNPTIVGTDANTPGDIGSGIGLTAGTYTHAIDIGNVTPTGPTVINGVTFSKLAAATNAALTQSNGTALSFSTAAQNNTNPGVSAAAGQAPSLSALLTDFQFNGAPGNLTLSGLIPGTAYSVRLYDNRYLLTAAGTGRNQTFTFTNGTSATTYKYDEDLLNNTNYFGFQYIAQSTSVTLSAAPLVAGNTYHWYAMTNQVVTGSTGTLTLGDAANSTFAGTLSGGLGTIVKTGAGTVTLQGAGITYAGGITVSAGTLSLSDAATTGAITNNATLNITGTSAAGTIASSIVNNATLTAMIASGAVTTATGAVTGPGTLTKLGSGTLNLAGTATYTGGTTISAGSLQLSGTAITPFVSAVTDNGNLILNRTTATSTFSAPVSGTGTVAKIGAGTVTLTGAVANTYAGATTVSGGTLVLDNTNGNAIGGDLIVGDALAGTKQVTLAAPAQIPDTANVTVNATGVLSMPFSETFGSLSGTGTVAGGVSYAPPPFSFTTDAGTGISPTKTYTHLLDFGSNGTAATINGVVFSKAVAGTFANTVAGSATLGGYTLTGGTGTTAQALANTSGSVTGAPAGSGLNVLLNDFYYNGFPDTLTLNGLTIGTTYNFDWYIRQWNAGDNRTIAATLFNGGSTVTLPIFDEDATSVPSVVGFQYTAQATSVTLTIARHDRDGTFHVYGVSNEVVPAVLPTAPTYTFGNASNTTFAGTLVGAANIVKQGSGAFTLQGNSIGYSGGTTVSAGNLTINDSASFNSPVTDNSDLTFNVDTGINTYTQAITGTGTLNKTGAGTEVLTNTVAQAGATTIAGGTLQLNDAAIASFVSSSVVDNGGLTLSQSTGAATFSAPISGTGGLSKLGAGTITLTGAVGNTFTGASTVSAGSLVLDKSTGNAIGGDLIVGDALAGTKLVQALLPNQIADASNITVNSSGILNLPFDETFGSLSGSGAVETGANGTPTTATFTSDAASGISSSKTYTAALDFGAATNPAAIINGVTFTKASNINSTNYQMAGAATAVTLGAGGTGADAGSGLETMFEDGYTGGNPATLNLLGLTPGTAYDFRVYTTQFAADTRVITLKLTNGGAVSTMTFDEDASTTPGYIDIPYTANANAITILFTPAVPANAVVLYGATNEVSAVQPASVPNLTFGNSSNTTFTGSLLGNMNVTKTGTGSATLAGANINYTGAPTVITAGNLTLSNATNFKTAIVDSSSLTLDATATTNLTTNISGTGTLTKTSAGIEVLTGTNTYLGDTTISGGTLRIGGAASLPNGTTVGNVILNPATGSATLDLAGHSETLNGLSSSGAGSSFVDSTAAGAPVLTLGANNASNSFGGVIENTAGIITLVVAGTGTLTLTGNNTYFGFTTINSGSTLDVGAGGTTGAIGRSAITDNGSLVVNRSTALTMNQNISGAGSLTNSGSGTLTIGGNNTYAGSTTVNAGTLQDATPAAPPTDYVAHYAFDGDTNDSTSNALNGTITGAGTSYVAGRFGQGINFTGSQYVSVAPSSPNYAALTLSTYTVSAWVNIAAQPASGAPDGILGTRTGGDDTFDMKYQAGGPTGFQIHGDIGTGTGGTWITIAADATLSAPLAVNTWNLITYVVSPTGYSIYLNGSALVTSAAFAATRRSSSGPAPRFCKSATRTPRSNRSRAPSTTSPSSAEPFPPRKSSRSIWSARTTSPTPRPST